MLADSIIDRRNLKRRLFFWRSAAFLCIAIVALLMPFRLFDGYLKDYQIEDYTSSKHLALIEITGTIAYDTKLLETINELHKNSQVEGVIFSLNTPGGHPAASEAIHDMIRKLAEAKPVAATIQDISASAGYLVAVSTDYVVSHSTSLTASIGAIGIFVDASKLLENIGLKLEAFQSGTLKAEPLPGQPIKPEVRKILDGISKEVSERFMDIVAERRKLSKEFLRSLEGQAMLGSQAKNLNLIDAIGGQEEVLRWMGLKGVDTTLEIVRYYPKQNVFNEIFGRMHSQVLDFANRIFVQISSNFFGLH